MAPSKHRLEDPQSLYIQLTPETLAYYQAFSDKFPLLRDNHVNGPSFYGKKGKLPFIIQPRLENPRSGRIYKDCIGQLDRNNPDASFVREEYETAHEILVIGSAIRMKRGKTIPISQWGTIDFTEEEGQAILSVFAIHNDHEVEEYWSTIGQGKQEDSVATEDVFTTGQEPAQEKGSDHSKEVVEKRKLDNDGDGSSSKRRKSEGLLPKNAATKLQASVIKAPIITAEPDIDVDDFAKEDLDYDADCSDSEEEDSGIKGFDSAAVSVAGCSDIDKDGHLGVILDEVSGVDEYDSDIDEESCDDDEDEEDLDSEAMSAADYTDGDGDGEGLGFETASAAVATGYADVDGDDRVSVLSDEGSDEEVLAVSEEQSDDGDEEDEEDSLRSGINDEILQELLQEHLAGSLQEVDKALAQVDDAAISARLLMQAFLTSGFIELPSVKEGIKNAQSKHEEVTKMSTSEEILYDALGKLFWAIVDIHEQDWNNRVAFGFSLWWLFDIRSKATIWKEAGNLKSAEMLKALEPLLILA